MKTFYIIVIGIFLSFQQLSGQLSELKKEVDKIIVYDTEIELNKTPGFVIGVIDRDTSFFLDYGNNGLKNKIPLTENTVFEIGSASKVFTAGLIESLVQKGMLSYDQKVNSFLPSEDQNPRMENLTLEDLVLHHSGLPKRPHFFGKKEKSAKNPYQNYYKKDLIDFYREYIPSKKKRKEKYKYAHTNYALLEYILELKFNTSYETLLAEHLLNPLQLDQTFVGTKEERLKEITNGFDRAGRNVNPWDFKSFSASEGIKSSVRDLCTYLKGNMAVSNTELDMILPKTLEIQTSSNLDKRISVGKAWHIVDNGNKFNIIMHTGTTGGHKAFMAFVNETKTGVVILANSTIGTEDLGMLILRMINHNWKRKV